MYEQCSPAPCKRGTRWLHSLDESREGPQADSPWLWAARSHIVKLVFQVVFHDLGDGQLVQKLQALQPDAMTDFYTTQILQRPRLSWNESGEEKGYDTSLWVTVTQSLFLNHNANKNRNAIVSRKWFVQVFHHQNAHNGTRHRPWTATKGAAPGHRCETGYGHWGLLLHQTALSQRWRLPPRGGNRVGITL